MLSRILIRYSYHIKKNNVKKVLICPDKFKFSLTSSQVSQVIKNSLPPSISSQIMMLADGGEGSLQTITSKVTGKWVQCQVNDPLFRKITAQYYETCEKQAYIQMAKASGLGLLEIFQRNPLQTTTLGTGQLILDSLKRGNKTIHLLVGGSSTNDGGIGCASALGYHFIQNNGNILSPIGKNLFKIASIKQFDLNLINKIKQTNMKVYTDVLNPLTGPEGCSYVYGPQKGASKQAQLILDKGLNNLNNLFKKQYGVDANKIPGSGAAGGLAGGCSVLLKAKVLRGIDLILKLSNFDQALDDVDLVITGEGKFDNQTLQGKVVKGVIDKCINRSKPVVVLSAIVQTRDLPWKEQSVKVVELLSEQDKKIIDPNVTRQRLQEAVQTIFR